MPFPRELTELIISDVFKGLGARVTGTCCLKIGGRGAVTCSHLQSPSWLQSPSPLVPYIHLVAAIMYQ